MPNTKKPLLAAVAAALLLAWLSLDAGTTAIDAGVRALAAAARGETVLQLFAALTWLGDGKVVAALCGLASVVLALRNRMPLVAGLWLGLAGSAATTFALKIAVARPRPEFVAGFTADSPSFPSSHASAAMAGYVLLAYVLSRDVTGRGTRIAAWATAATLALLVAGSRLVLGLHHGTDVLAGLMVGTVWAGLAIAAAEDRLAGAPARSERRRRNAAGPAFPMSAPASRIPAAGTSDASHSAPPGPGLPVRAGA